MEPHNFRALLQWVFLEDDGSMQKAGRCRFRNRDSSARLTVVQYEQTTVWATLRIMHREEVRQSLQGRVHFILLGRLRHGNNLDRSTGAVFARWRWVGIFAVAPLTRLTDNRVNMLLDPICVILTLILVPLTESTSQSLSKLRLRPLFLGS